MAAAAPPPSPAFVRAIGRHDLTAAIVNGVIGSSVFGMPAVLAAHTGAQSPLACALAGLGILAIVLCFAEVASRFDDAGGQYLYVRESMGAFAGFQTGWLVFWTRVTALAANLNVFVDYASRLWPAVGASSGRAAVMSLVVAVIAGINVAGVRQAALAVNVFTVAKLLPLVALVALGLPRISGDVLATQAVARADWTQAVLLLMFAYGGFEAPLIPAREARDPRRDTMPALLVALATIAGVYLLVQLVIVGVVPGVAGVKAPVAEAYAILLGPPGATLAVAAALVSVWGYSTGSALQAPRLLHSMAERRELPGLLARVHERFRTPHLAIVGYALLTLAVALAGTFEAIATLSAIVRLVTYALTCLALLLLRRQRPDEAPGFRLPAAGFIAPIGIGLCLWLLATRSLAQAWALVILMALGGVLYAVSGRGGRGAIRAAAD